MLCGILFDSKSLPYKSTLRNAKKFKGGSYRPPKKGKKSIFLRFLGAWTRRKKWTKLPKNKDEPTACTHFAAHSALRHFYFEMKVFWTLIFLLNFLLMEDNLWWKTTFDGRHPLMEDDLWWKTTIDLRWYLMDKGLWWQANFDGSWHNGRQSLMQLM